MGEMNNNENKTIENQSTRDALDDDYYFIETEEEEIARYEKIIVELTEFEKSQMSDEN